MSILSELNRQFGSYGSHYIVTNDQSAIIFGNEENDDLVTKSLFRLRIKKSVMYGKHHQLKYSQSKIDELLNRFNQEIAQVPSQNFVLSSGHISALQDTIKLSDATHIRFFSDKNRIKISIFNYRKFINDVTPLIDDNFAISELTLNEFIVSSDFTFTIKATSFLKIPEHTYEVEFLRNGIIGFTSLDADIEFFFRDQEIQEPIINFVNEKLGKEISLLWLPTTDKTLGNTNQLLD